MTHGLLFRWWRFMGEPTAVSHYRSALKGYGPHSSPEVTALGVRWRADTWAAMTDEEQQYCAWRGMLIPPPNRS